jgi:hypothetical protein
MMQTLADLDRHTELLEDSDTNLAQWSGPTESGSEYWCVEHDAVPHHT